jgi:hypothetical protein
VGGGLALSLAGIATLLVVLALVRQKAHGYLRKAPAPDHHVDVLNEDDDFAACYDAHLSREAADI